MSEVSTEPLVIEGETDTRLIEALMNDPEMWIKTPEIGIQILCALRSHVHRTLDTEYFWPDDCICPAETQDRAHRYGETYDEYVQRHFRANGNAIRFIITATLEKLERENAS